MSPASLRSKSHVSTAFPGSNQRLLRLPDLNLISSDRDLHGILQLLQLNVS
jgi:hypothetical protein